MQIQVRTFRRQRVSRATVYNKPVKIVWEERRGYSYRYRQRDIDFLQAWPDIIGKQSQSLDLVE